MAGHMEMAFSPNLINTLRTLLSPVARLTGDEMESGLGRQVQRALLVALDVGNLAIFADIVERLLPEAGISIDAVVQLIRAAAVNLRHSEFRQILTIPTSWTISHGYGALGTLALHMHGPKKVVLEISKALVRHLDDLRLLRDVVNYVPPGTSCEPNCTQRHAHTFLPSLFWMWTNSGHYEIARLLTPYVDYNLGVPTALYHFLESPDRNILDHVAFLMELGEPHRRYVCFPILNRTALQVVAKRNGKYMPSRTGAPWIRSCMDMPPCQILANR